MCLILDTSFFSDVEFGVCSRVFSRQTNVIFSLKKRSVFHEKSCEKTLEKHHFHVKITLKNVTGKILCKNSVS